MWRSRLIRFLAPSHASRTSRITPTEDAGWHSQQPSSHHVLMLPGFPSVNRFVQCPIHPLAVTLKLDLLMMLMARSINNHTRWRNVSQVLTYGLPGTRIIFTQNHELQSPAAGLFVWRPNWTNFWTRKAGHKSHSSCSCSCCWNQFSRVQKSLRLS